MCAVQARPEWNVIFFHKFINNFFLKKKPTKKEEEKLNGTVQYEGSKLKKKMKRIFSDKWN